MRVAPPGCGKFTLNPHGAIDSLTHALAPLLTPRSIAQVGASRKRNSVGNDTLRNLLSGGYRGALYPVNPSYRELYGRDCHAGIAQLPYAFTNLPTPSAAFSYPFLGPATACSVGKLGPASDSLKRNRRMAVARPVATSMSTASTLPASWTKST